MTETAQDDVFLQISTILSNVGGVEQDAISPESRLSEDLAISSLNLIESVVHVEDAFGFRIEEADVKDFHTVADIVAFIAKHRAS